MNENSVTSENTYWLLIQVAMRAKQTLMHLAEKHDLSAMQMFTMATMQPGQPTPMNTISCILGCDASNVTGIVDRLLAHDLIKREENPKDRRVKMITLTPKGEALRSTMFGELAEFQLPGFSSLTDVQQHQLGTLLTVIMEHTQSAQK